VGAPSDAARMAVTLAVLRPVSISLMLTNLNGIAPNVAVALIRGWYSTVPVESMRIGYMPTGVALRRIPSSNRASVVKGRSTATTAASGPALSAYPYRCFTDALTYTGAATLTIFRSMDHSVGSSARGGSVPSCDACAGVATIRSRTVIVDEELRLRGSSFAKTSLRAACMGSGPLTV
jgi:hypothetical protein